MVHSLGFLVRVNEILSGVRQGDLSPTLFNFYINDLASGIKNLNLGIPIDDQNNVNILPYADDIVLLAENEKNLQQILDHLYNCCLEWKLEINEDKTNLVHFRKNYSRKTNTQFKFSKNLDLVNEYKYLGLYTNIRFMIYQLDILQQL